MLYSNPASSPSIQQLFSLAGKNALVIGGAGLLGSEMAFTLAELGAKVYVASRDLEKCKVCARQLNEAYPRSEATPVQIDITNKKSIQSAINEIAELTGGRLDILINCGWSGRKNTFESISDDDWDNDIEVSLNGVFRTIKAVAPLLKPNRGVILNVSSMYGHIAPDYRMYDGEKYANPPSYGAAKAGVLQLTRYLSSFLAVDGIRVNAISPGPFPFESTQKENPEFIERLAAKNPLNRIGKPHELKGATALLCSDASSYMTGQNICVDGGWAAW